MTTIAESSCFMEEKLPINSCQTWYFFAMYRRVSVLTTLGCSYPAFFFNSRELSGHLTLKVLVATIDAQWEGMGDVGSARYKPALVPPCPTIRVLSYSNLVNFQKFSTVRVKLHICYRMGGWLGLGLNPAGVNFGGQCQWWIWPCLISYCGLPRGIKWTDTTVCCVRHAANDYGGWVKIVIWFWMSHKPTGMTSI